MPGFGFGVAIGLVRQLLGPPAPTDPTPPTGTVPATAVLQEDGTPILDEDGSYQTSET